MTALAPPLPIPRTNRTVTPRPTGGAISVAATVRPQQFPLGTVELVYVVGYGPETAVPMTGEAGRCSAAVSAARQQQQEQSRRGACAWWPSLPSSTAQPCCQPCLLRFFPNKPRPGPLPQPPATSTLRKCPPPW